MQSHKLYGFTDVDHSHDPQYFIQFLDSASALDSFQAYKSLTTRLVDPKPGHRILEIGCGTGDDVKALAPLVMPGGEVVGIDASEAMIAEARKRSADGKLPVRFETGDALKLAFADNSFDACRCDRTFMHLENPGQAVREMKRVTRVGGMIVVYEVDFGTIAVDVPNRELGRRIINCWCDSFRNGWLGRHVPALFQEAGLDKPTIIPATLILDFTIASYMIGPATLERAQAANIISAAEAADWLRQLEELRDAGRFFCTLTGFVVAARKAQ